MRDAAPKVKKVLAPAAGRRVRRAADSAPCPFTFRLGWLRRGAAPVQEQADIADEAAGEIEHARDHMKAERFQLALVAQISFGRFSAQRGWPIRFGHVDGPAAIAAQIAGKAQDQQLGFAMAGGDPRLLQEAAPMIVRDVVIDGVLDLQLSLAGRGSALSFQLCGLFRCGSLDERAEIGRGECFF